MFVCKLFLEVRYYDFFQNIGEIYFVKKILIDDCNGYMGDNFIEFKIIDTV